MPAPLPPLPNSHASSGAMTAAALATSSTLPFQVSVSGSYPANRSSGPTTSGAARPPSEQPHVLACLAAAGTGAPWPGATGSGYCGAP